MSFTYRPRGDDVVLSAESTAEFAVEHAVADEVAELAQRNVNETGRACDVFANDGTTILLRVRPA